MGNFNRDRGGGFNKRRYNDNSDRERPEMHRATCAECGKPCEVPFRPSADKPVFCRDCFDKRGGKEGGYQDRGNRERNFNRFDSGDKRMFPATCDSCGKRCEVPFRPSSGKPVYCSDCFGHKEDNRDNRGENSGGTAGGNTNAISELKAQINTINTKLDRVLRALELRGQIGPVEEITIKSEPEEEVVNTDVVEKPKKVVKTKVKTAPKTAVKKKVVTKKAKK